VAASSASDATFCQITLILVSCWIVCPWTHVYHGLSVGRCDNRSTQTVGWCDVRHGAWPSGCKLSSTYPRRKYTADWLTDWLTVRSGLSSSLRGRKYWVRSHMFTYVTSYDRKRRLLRSKPTTTMMSLNLCGWSLEYYVTDNCDLCVDFSVKLHEATGAFGWNF